jgi:ribosomal peptide maturation radical SAM protein 1
VKVVIACLPFVTGSRPVLGASTLKARLGERGIACDVAYLSLAFSEAISRWDYEHIGVQMSHHLLAGEWVFTGCLYGEGADPGLGYLEELAANGWLDGRSLEVLRRARSAAPGFIEDCVRTVPWSDYDVIGFSSSTAQNIASLALARRLRERFPEIPLIFGGANWQGEMGAELLRRFPFVDLVFSGEADDSLPAVLERMATGAAHPWRGVPGVLGRSAGRVTGTAAEAAAAVRLDDLPDPDHDDYFFTLKERPAACGAAPAITAETTRGCWWAQKQPCGFCGLDHTERRFRAKSPRRVVAEFRRLAGKYSGGRLHLADYVVAPSFFTGVLPELARDPLPVPLFISVRPDITREQVRLAGRVHAHIQPGIESLDDHVLELMHKGTRGLENVRLLRWCKESGVVAHWNALWGFPGETAEDFEAMRRTVPAISFLTPPSSAGNVSLDRYSPFHVEPADHGFHDLRPLKAYAFLYPFPRDSRARIAYAFEHRCDPPALASAGRRAMERCLEDWGRKHTGQALVRTRGHDGRLCLLDDRPAAPVRRIELDPLDEALYLACDGIAAREDLHARIGDGAEVDDRLDAFVRRGLMVTDGDRYLSVALDRSWQAEM